jgi:Tol biopolymer transport system component
MRILQAASVFLRPHRLPMLCGLLTVSAPAFAETTTLLSTTTQGTSANGASDRPAISADGRYVAFQSSATNLITTDTNGRSDIFLLDRQSGSLTRVNKGTGGAESNADSEVPAISANGRFVAFESTSTNLVSGDSNLVRDIFVYDTLTAATVRVSVASNGTQGNGDSFRPQLSSDGRYVAFVSDSTVLAMGDSNGVADIFLHDRDPDGNGLFDEGNGTTERASLNVGGSQLTTASDFPSISSDGRYVSFTSGSGVYVYDRMDDSTQSLVPLSNGTSTFTSISSDGRYVAFASAATNLVTGDANGFIDVFVHDRTLATTILASLSQSELQPAADSSAPVISADGRYVAFVTEATSLTTRTFSTRVAFDAVSGATGGGGGTGTAKTYYVYRRDLQLGSTVRASSAYGGATPSGTSENPAINSDGTLIAFVSPAGNLTCASDSNLTDDVFLRDLRSSTATGSCGTTGTTTTSSGGGAFGLAVLAMLGIAAAIRRATRP